MQTSDEFIAKLDKRDPIVYQAFDEFKKFFDNDWRNTKVSEIIDGENISIKPENIRIDDPIDPEYFSEAEQNQVKLVFEKFCTKKPYQYQIDSAMKILEMENKQERVYDGETIVSNGYQLSLPIGAGKSLVFEFLALFFPNVKLHPIIVSTNGTSIPEHEQIQMEKYPFFYENATFIKEKTPAVMVLETELQRKCTVILTYHHLLNQMKYYFSDDWKKQITSKKRIEYVDSYQLKDDFDIDNCDILVVVADEPNVNKLIQMSYIKPFARVIIDDYTNMTDLPYLRQILTFSFIPVSGSGFEKNINEIPSSYYSLKNIPSEKIKLVGNPDKVYEGVIRTNVLTGEIMTCVSEFDIYSFVSFLEDACRRLPGCDKEAPSTLFKEINDRPIVENYIKYGFFVQNIDSFRSTIPMLIADIESGEADKNKVSCFVDWFNNTPDKKFRDLMRLPLNAGNNNAKSISTLINSKCIICQRTKENTLGFGIISSCCGAFICASCIDKASTHEIVDTSTTEKLYTKDCYCVCCRCKNPRYYFNSRATSSTNETYAYTLAQRFFDISEVDGHYPVDYYFYMIKNGWTPRLNCSNGKGINIYNDIKQGLISKDVFETNTIPEINKIKSADILFPQVLSAIYNTFVNLKIKPVDRSVIIVYKCKDILRKRIIDLFEMLKTQQGSPLSETRLVFVDNISSIIGMQLNVLALLVYDDSTDEYFSRRQLIGRIIRISSSGQKLIIYVRNNKTAYE